MFKHKLKVLLFLENAGVRNGNYELKATKLVFFPNNITSCTQPMDAGIIQVFKLNYSAALHKHLVNMLSSKSTAGQDPFKSIDLVRAVIFTFKA